MADTDRYPEYDIRINHDLGDVYGNLVDNRGRFDKSAMRQTQFGRLSLKMGSGGTKHSDYEPPYRSIEQRDFSGGRGLDNLDLDEARFYDSYRCETWREGIVIPGPEEEYGEGVRAAIDDYWWQDSNQHDRVEMYATGEDTTEFHFSHQFTASATYTPKYIYLAFGPHNATGLSDTGGSVLRFQADIYSNSGGEPDASLMSTEQVQRTTYGTYIYRLAIGTPAELTATTSYHFVVKCWTTSLNLTSDNFGYFIGQTTGASTHYSSEDGSTWDAAVKGLFFRIVPDETAFESHYFTHKSCLYTALSYKDGSAPKVFKCGDRGIATGSSATTLSDSTKTWTADNWINSFVMLTSGTGANAQQRWRVITDNDTNSITVADWDITPDETTEYAIVGSKYWDEVTGHGMTGQLTDVHVHNNIVYFMRGDNDDIFHMYEETFASEVGNRGTYMETAPDTNGKTKIWLAKRGFPAAVQKSDPAYVEAGDSIPDLDFDHKVTVDNPDCEEAGSWLDSGTPNSSARDTSEWGITPYSGTYFWAVDADDGEGVYQELSAIDGVVDGDLYRISARVNVSDTNYSNGAKMVCDSTTVDSNSSVYDEWILFTGQYRATSATIDLKFLSDGGRQQFGIDSVSVENISETTSSMGDEIITGIIAYGEPERLWVATDGNLYMEDTGQFIPIPLKEFKNARDDRNGRALLVHDVFLYTSFMDGLERYYKANLDDMGPNRDEGMPTDRRGSVVSMVGYPGRFYVAIDGGADNYSSILLFNGFGWHETYRAPDTGIRITNLYIHPLPGDYVDRLYFNEGSDVAWVGVDFNPVNNSNYRYTVASMVDLQTIYANRNEVEKHFATLKLSTRGYSTVYAYYGTNNETITSHEATLNIGEFTTLPSDSNNIDVENEFIHVKIMLETASAINPIRFESWVCDLLEHTPVKDSHSFQILLGDRKKSLAGRPAHTRYETDYDLLKSIVNSAAPGILYSPSSASSGNSVKFTGCEPNPIWINARGQVEQSVVTVTCVDV